MARIQPTTRERIIGTHAMLDAFENAPGEQGVKHRKGIAMSIVKGWHRMTLLVSENDTEGMLVAFKIGRWKKISSYFPVSFKIEHGIPLTDEDLAAGPESGWWFVRANLLPFSWLPGIPYIHNPLSSWIMSGFPLFRIVDSPFGK